MHRAATLEHEMPTTTGLNSVKMLMWVFLASDCMFFGTLIATFLVYAGKSLTGPTAKDILNIPYTSVSAFVLLLSSLFMVLALAGIQRGSQRQLRIWLLATAFAGMIFLGGQYYEFNSFFHEGLTPQTNLFGTTFFVLTGFHGLHVTGGVIWLLSLFVASLRGLLPPEKALNVEIAGLYWHFVDVVWIVIFTVVYLIQTAIGH